MARKKVDVDAGVASSVYDAFFGAELKQATVAMGKDDVVVGGQDSVMRFGLPIPSLALQYALQSDVFPMAVMTMLAGKPASHKSSFAFEIARWCITAGGYARLWDAEHKFNPDLAAGILGPLPDSRSWQYRRPDTIDEWSTNLAADVSLYREHFKLRDGDDIGSGLPLIPGCTIIDSLTGRASSEISEKFEKKGETDTAQGMRIANAIGRWLQLATFKHLPWIVLVIRHEKEGGINQSFSGFGAPQPNTPGGKAPDYHNSLDLRFSVIERTREANYGYNTVRIKVHKNAFGVDKLSCDVRFSWTWMDEADGKQAPRWEWDLATAQLLANYDRADIKQICHVTQSGTKARPLFSCRTLGVSEVNGDDFGMALRANPEITKALQDYLHISRLRQFTPDIFAQARDER